MKDYKVYCYIFPSGKRYIGQTKTSLAVRAGPDGSNYSGCIRFWNAIQKYGWHNLKSEILADNLTKKVWERRKALDKSTRKSLIGGSVRNNKSTEA